MTETELLELINSKFNTQVDFVNEFNKKSGVNLTTTYLSRQIKGKVPLKQGWIAAYRLFFLYCG